MRPWMIGLAVAGALYVAGCSGSSTQTPAAVATQSPAAATQSASPTGDRPQPVAVPAAASPDQVVSVFLNALRTGDSPTTESLLTSKAREELDKHDLSVDVQSAPNATYIVHPAEILKNNPDGAHVKSVWTEKYEDGAEEPYEIVWVLRRQPEGWRVAGMAMQLIPGEDPQFLNFEDPADMLRKKDEAVALLQAAAAETAQQPQQLGVPQGAKVER